MDTARFIVRLEPSLIDKFSENQLKKELERIQETVSSLYKMKISLKSTRTYIKTR